MAVVRSLCVLLLWSLASVAVGAESKIPSSAPQLWGKWGDATVVKVGLIVHQVPELVHFGMIEKPFHHHIPAFTLRAKDGKEFNVTIQKIPQLLVQSLDDTVKAELKKKHAFGLPGLPVNWALKLTPVSGTKAVRLGDVFCKIGKDNVKRLTEYEFISNNCQHWSHSFFQSIQSLSGGKIPGVDDIKLEPFDDVREAKRERSQGHGVLNALTPGLTNEEMLNIGDFFIKAVTKLRGGEKLASMTAKCTLP